MRRICLSAALLLACLQSGHCAWTYPPRSPAYTPERPQPTRAELEALAKGGGVEAQEAPFSVTAPAVLVGGSVEVRCHVPPSWGVEHVKIAVVLPGLGPISSSMGRSLEVQGVPCGAVAWCATVTPAGKVREIARALAVGGCDRPLELVQLLQLPTLFPIAGRAWVFD